jgi:hypothetical protein
MRHDEFDVRIAVRICLAIMGNTKVASSSEVPTAARQP